MYKLAPSLLEADFKYLKDQLDLLKAAGANYLHLDVMDGNFVPNLSFGLPIVRSVRSATDLTLDVHLMVSEPIRFVRAFQEAGADVICVHYEACRDLAETLALIKQSGARAGIALKPETPAAVLEPELLRQADVIHVMTVCPGVPNQSFIPGSLRKIRAIRHMMEGFSLEREIEVDGDITLMNVREVIRAGANIIVSGKAIFDGDPQENIKKFQEQIEGEEADALELCNRS